MESSQPIYRYSPLSSKEHCIRLVILQPGAFDDLIKFNIIITTISIAPSYEALSYAWGGSKPPFREYGVVDETILPISSTLSTALRHLRNTLEKRTLWIDAICINQNDIDERNVQVSFIGEIYAGAKRVVVWLGPGDSTSSKAMGFLKEIARRKAAVKVQKAIEQGWKGLGIYGLDDAKNVIKVEMRRALREKDRYEDAISSGSLGLAMDDQYQIQNIIMEKEHSDEEWTGFPTKLTGRRSNLESEATKKYYYSFFTDDRQQDWEALEGLLSRPWFSRVWVIQEAWKATDAIVQCGSMILEWKGFGLAMSVIESWDDMTTLKRGSFINTKRLEIRRRYSLAIYISNRQRLGGKLSDLLWDTWHFDASDPKDKVFAIFGLANKCYQAMIELDYSKDLRSIFKQTASAIIRKEGNLDLLLAGCGLSRPGGMPSWVPDWRREAISKPNQERPILYVRRIRRFRGMSEYDASGYVITETKAIFDFSENLDILCVSGKNFDVIAKVDDMHNKITGREIVESAVRLVVDNAAQLGLQSSQVDINRKVRQLFIAGNDRGFDELDFDGVAQNVMNQRCFFITKNGRIGVGPIETKEGHIVSIIAGCTFPMILCKEGDHYLLVGEEFGTPLKRLYRNLLTYKVYHLMEKEVENRQSLQWKSIELH